MAARTATPPPKFARSPASATACCRLCAAQASSSPSRCRLPHRSSSPHGDFVASSERSPLRDGRLPRKTPREGPIDLLAAFLAALAVCLAALFVSSAGRLDPHQVAAVRGELEADVGPLASASSGWDRPPTSTRHATRPRGRSGWLPRGRGSRPPRPPSTRTIALQTRHDPRGGPEVVPARFTLGGRPRPGSTRRRKPAIPQRKHWHDRQHRGCDAQPPGTPPGQPGVCDDRVTQSSGDVLPRVRPSGHIRITIHGPEAAGRGGQGGIRWTGRCRSRC